VSGDVLRGLHPDVCQDGLGHDVGVQAADGHQAAQVAALVVRLVVLVQTHLGGGPALQVARAVDGAEALTVRWDEGRVGRERERERDSVRVQASASAPDGETQKKMKSCLEEFLQCTC